MKKYIFMMILSMVTSMSWTKTCHLTLAERNFQSSGSKGFTEIFSTTFEADTDLKDAGINQRNVIDITEKGLKVTYVVSQNSERSSFSKMSENEVSISVFDLENRYLISRSQQTYKTLEKDFKTFVIIPDVKNHGNLLSLNIQCN